MTDSGFLYDMTVLEHKIKDDWARITRINGLIRQYLEKRRVLSKY
jgi:hypothetical protein